jgi:SAM-dependent methyltransferase
LIDYKNEGGEFAMRWKQKARIQNTIAMLPASVRDHIYYFIQRKFGGLHEMDNTSRWQESISILDCIRSHDRDFESKVFLEIGTGPGLSIPIALWLCGASKIITVDLNPYLKEEIVLEQISCIKNDLQEILPLFEKYAQRPVFLERIDRLTTKINFNDFLRMANIHYMAPVDARCLDLQPESIDYHISYTVLEHIPLEVLEGILLEGKRLLRKDGLFIHGIDMSDHFSHADSSILPINFLQFDENRWAYYAGNKYAYHNRLRLDDYVDLFTRVGLTILSMSKKVDEKSLEELIKGFPLDERFKVKSDEVNATSSARIVATAFKPAP